MPMSYKKSFSPPIFQTKLVRICDFYQSHFMPCPSHLPRYDYPNNVWWKVQLWCFQLCSFIYCPTTSSSLCCKMPIETGKSSAFRSNSVNSITIKCHFNEVSTPIVIIWGTWWGRAGCFSVRWVVKWWAVPSCKCPSGKWLLSLLWSDIWCSVPWCIWGTSSRFETGPQHSVWWLPSAKAVIKENVIFIQHITVEIIRKMSQLNTHYLVQQDNKCVHYITLRYIGLNYEHVHLILHCLFLTYSERNILFSMMPKFSALYNYWC